jgi:hypothetical protein
MPIEVGKDGQASVFIGPEATNFYRMVTLLSCMKTELKTGMRLSTRIPSPFRIVKKEFGLKGNKQKIVDQFQDLVNAENKKMVYK